MYIDKVKDVWTVLLMYSSIAPGVWARIPLEGEEDMFSLIHELTTLALFYTIRKDVLNIVAILISVKNLLKFMLIYL